jgi:hypothetical protein
MFRKILIAVVASLSCLAPLALPAESQAHEFHRRFEYRVYIRGCAREPWRFGGEYHSRAAAFHAAQSFRARGFETSVR